MPILAVIEIPPWKFSAFFYEAPILAVIEIPPWKSASFFLCGIFAKHLYFLIPFHIFKFEKELPDCNSNDENYEVIH